MSSSAINSQIWNAKAANVQNADGSPIYAAGVWSFKSSTNVVTFSVSDAGAVTAGPAAFAGTNCLTINMENATRSQNYINFSGTYGGAIGGRKSTGSTSITANAYQTTYNVDSWTQRNNAIGSSLIDLDPSGQIGFYAAASGKTNDTFANFWTLNGSCAPAGAWTLGPVASSAINLAVNGGARIRASTSVNDSAYLYLSRQDDNSSVRFGANFASGVASGKFFADAVEVGGFSNAGAWTAGPAAGTTTALTNIVNGGKTNGSSPGLQLNNYYSTGTVDCLRIYLGVTSSGGIQTTSGGTPTFYAASDERLKENIVPDTTDHLSKLLSIKLRKYQYIADQEHKEHIGPIAQELQRTHPELISEKDGFLSVSMDFTWELIGALQQQQAQIEELRLLIKGA